MEHSLRGLYKKSVLLLCGMMMVLLLASLLLLTYAQTRHDRQRELATEARMLAMHFTHNAQPDAAEKMLKSAGVDSLLILACAFDAQGHVVAENRGASFEHEPMQRSQCEHVETYPRSVRTVSVSVPIIAPDAPKASGRVVLLSRVPPIAERLPSVLAVAFALALLVGVLCWQLGEKLKRLTLKPIRQIATTAQRVTLYKDYSLRVMPAALAVVPTEIKALTDSFNAMLDEIEDRDGRLTRKTTELEAARRNAEAASITKSQFLANVSHELRTPLNAIIGFSTMLQEEQFGAHSNPKYREYASDILDSGKHLLDVINDILDLSKAESGNLRMKFEALSLPKIVDKSLHIITGQALARKVDIYTHLPSKLPKITADRVRLMQILLNLLSNAVKFTPEGGKVIVPATAEPGRNGVHFFTLEVEDNGIGMEQEEIDKAFSTFNQADAGLNRKYEGAGLGLPLTKRLVELHHGKIRIESIKGKGTKVIVRLTSDPALLD